MPTIMAGDIGGTSSRFMLYEVSSPDRLDQGSKPPGELVYSRIYANENVAHFCDQVSAFFKDAGIKEPPETACIAVAGPVMHNTVTMTNRNWLVDGEELEKTFNIPVVELLNDFEAAGYGLLSLDIATECTTLQAGVRIEGAPIACIGSGTGLGETFLTCPRGGGLYDAWASEGGHSEMAPRNDLEWELCKHIQATRNTARVSVERVVSGRGLVNVYEFLSKRFPDRVDLVVHEAIQKAGDQKGKIISMNSTEPGSICEQVMHIWATHFGAEAGVLGLRCLPQGGIFLAGGMTPKNLHFLQGQDSPFMKGFMDKGRVSGLLKSFPIYALLVEDMGLRGAHVFASRLYRSRKEEAMRSNHRFKKAVKDSIVFASAVTVLSFVVLSWARRRK